jgi:hypothetical protein
VSRTRRSLAVAAALAGALVLVSARSSAQQSRDAAAKEPAVRKLDRHGPRNAVSVHPWSFLGPGVALQYERYAFPRWVSVVSGLGFRTSGQEDFGSFSFSTALEGRLWLIGRAPFTRSGDRAMVGPYLAARVDLTWTRVWHEPDGRTIGTTIEHEEAVLFGYRLALGPVEASPFVGVGATTQHDTSGRLAAVTNPALKAGLALGIMF